VLRRALTITPLALALAWLVPAVGLSGCVEGEVSGQPAWLCVTDRDCDAGRVCDFSHCVAPGVNALTVHARLIPPANSGLVSQQVPELCFADGPDRLIHLLEPATLRGVVRPRGDSFTPNVPGELELRTPGDIPGLDYRFATVVHSGVDDQGDGFALRVLPGRHYRGSFRPDDRDIPSFAFEVLPEQVETGRLEVQLPAATDYVQLGGRLRAVDYTPVGGARIVALLADDSVAGVATTEGQRGQFAMTLPPGLTSARLRISAPTDGIVFPDFVTDPLAPSTDLDITIPELPAGIAPFDARVAVVAPDEEGDLTPMPGVTVTIVGDLGSGSLRRTGTTSADGVVSFLALPGAYECLVTTAPDSPFASWHGYVNLAGSPTELLAPDPARIELRRRAPLVGTILDDRGEPVIGGEVHASRRVERGTGHVLAIAPPPFRTQISSDGRYQMLVDPGSYDVRVIPSKMSGAPPVVLGGVVVGAGGLDLPFYLPSPGLAHITVARPDGTYMPGVSVELYLPAAERRADEVEPPALLVRGTTGEQGFVDLLVPALP